MVKRYWADNTVGWVKWFDLDLWTCDLKINRDHLLIQGNPCTKFGIDQVKGSKDIEQTTQWAKKRRNPCTKFGIDQVKGSKDIEQTTQWAEKSCLTLTFEHVTWKSIGIIYSLRATPAPSLVLIKWRGQKDIERTTCDLQTNWPTDIRTDNCKTICPQGEHNN